MRNLALFFRISYSYCIIFFRKELVAQWTRACGYEPQGRGFESLLARKKKNHTIL